MTCACWSRSMVSAIDDARELEVSDARAMRAGNGGRIGWLQHMLPTQGILTSRRSELYLYPMDLYLASLATGAVGLGIMGFGGLSHGGHAGHGHAGHGHAGHGLAPHGKEQSIGGHLSHLPGKGTGWSWTSLLSPRLLFSLLVGFGAGGMAATPLGEPWQLAAAVVVAAGFETLLAGPLWRFLFRFESRAATTLESSIEDEARAVTGFDANGCGLVALNVDGQVVQLLATLAPDERSRGIRIRSGDLVRIAEVDAARGRCTVTAPTR